jgi:HSP20 family protein
MAKALAEMGRSLNRTWQNVAEGWRELVGRCNSALTRFSRQSSDDKQTSTGSPAFPRWSVLAGEVIDRDKSIVVQVEVPGITREDCDITIHNHALRIRGEKRMDREHIGDTYYIMERAYGSFERLIPLPVDVDPDSAQATLRNGVLKVELKKRPSASRRLIPVK